MKKRFVAKKTARRVFFKIIFGIFVCIFAFICTFNFLLNKYLKTRLQNSHISNDLLEFGTNQKQVISFDLLDPGNMLRLALNYNLNNKTETAFEHLEFISKHENDENPLVYIYNTHDKENYDSTLFESYNINYNVKIASFILSEHLKKLGIPSYVEESDMASYLRENNLSYNNSYDASRHYINKRKAEYPSIKYFIDLHRDSIGRSASVASIDDKLYAKVLFVVGLDNQNYKPNLNLAEKMNSKLDKQISRGILKKETVQKKSFYNQDIDGNIVLLEIGGVENNIEEVSNTLEIIAKIYFELLNEV